jgi:hypothetical protein
MIFQNASTEDGSLVWNSSYYDIFFFFSFYDITVQEYFRLK